MEKREISRREFLQQVLLFGLAATPWAQLGKVWAQASRPSDPQVIPTIAGQPVTHVTHGPGFGRKLALTFDDGPWPGITDRILAELATHEIPATFFMLGERVEAAPELARKVLAEGHEIGNHTFSHPKLSSLSLERVEREIGRCNEALAQHLNYRPRWFRPPYGALRKDQVSLVTSQGMGIVYWSVDTRDWSQPGVQAIQNVVLKDSVPGSIVLMHDLHRQTAEALPKILEGLVARGFEFATISGLVGSPTGAHPSPMNS
ncbi:polysaccharide deacetylase family protein [Candidatus Methylacidithermus pantelleriae]|uniref:NodB homology domain-containing protein n=1 Tax=Candidatus Methylacidithermus pantelleriae TaxID=2744239 RepID=A0A8J2FX93_9BACT|nr:polysaccharide deacetylase family protein [Candidatus Methylacidithermus pantelleriae]CAF0703855.1 NodB homology domain-containing protein [Candidatus Methylacidithermus pantelleriae]